MLAPAAFYDHFDLLTLELAVDRGVRRLGERNRVQLSFGFDVLPEALTRSPPPADVALLNALDGGQPLSS